MRRRGMTSFFASCLSVNIKKPEYDMLKIIRSINKQKKNIQNTWNQKNFILLKCITCAMKKL